VVMGKEQRATRVTGIKAGSGKRNKGSIKNKRIRNIYMGGGRNGRGTLIKKVRKSNQPVLAG